MPLSDQQRVGTSVEEAELRRERKWDRCCRLIVQIDSGERAARDRAASTSPDKCICDWRVWSQAPQTKVPKASAFG